MHACVFLDKKHKSDSKARQTAPSHISLFHNVKFSNSFYIFLLGFRHFYFNALICLIYSIVEANFACFVQVDFNIPVYMYIPSPQKNLSAARFDSMISE